MLRPRDLSRAQCGSCSRETKYHSLHVLKMLFVPCPARRLIVPRNRTRIPKKSRMQEQIASRLKSLGLTLPPPPVPSANYVPFAISGPLLHLSGQGPQAPDGSWGIGKVGSEVSIEDACQHARLAGLRLLSVAQSALGSLDRVQRVVKLLGFVNGEPTFREHPKIIDGCSALMIEVFGDAGRHARSSIGAGSLPRNMTVEIEAIFEIR